MILIDTSSWIHMLRPDGDVAVRARVESAIEAGMACWCSMVRLELWNGARGDREKRVLRDLERLLPALVVGDDVWRSAYDLARRTRTAGVTVPATDLIIAACAHVHGVSLEHADSDFDLLARVVTATP